MERPNVKLCLQIFNEHVRKGLILCLAILTKFCTETADYISFIIKWWKIMNVNSKFKGLLQKKDYIVSP